MLEVDDPAGVDGGGVGVLCRLRLGQITVYVDGGLQFLVTIGMPPYAPSIAFRTSAVKACVSPSAAPKEAAQPHLASAGGLKPLADDLRERMRDARLVGPQGLDDGASFTG